MKRLLVVGLGVLLAACSSMPSWVPGGGWTTLIDGDKGMENFNKLGGANWRAEGGAIVADKSPDNSYLVTKNSYKTSRFAPSSGPTSSPTAVFSSAPRIRRRSAPIPPTR